MRRPTVVFRVDASLDIGHGHAMRCLTLAGALRARGARVSFVCRAHRGHLCDLLEQRGFAVDRLPAGVPQSPADETPAHAAWLGAGWPADAEQTLAAIRTRQEKPDWLIVDHYAIDRRWESVLRPAVERIMVIDDLADRPHDCDLLLDQNLMADANERYRDKVPAGCDCLLGPAFALLQDEYAALRARAAPREGPLRRLFVFFSGADRDDLTGRTLSAFLGLRQAGIGAGIEVDAVVAGPHGAALAQRFAGRPGIRLHRDLPSLAPLMLKADLAVGACGVATWERLCLGLPALGISLSDNQRPIAEEAGRRQLIDYLGHHDEVDEATLARAIGAAIERGADPAASRRALDCVDGLGSLRVCAALLTDAATPIRLRPACVADLPTFRRDETDESRLRDSLRDAENCRPYIVENEDRIPLALLRWLRDDGRWRHDLRPALPLRRHALDAAMLAAGLLRLRRDSDGVLPIAARAASPAWTLAICSDRDSWINPALPELILGWTQAGHAVDWAHDAASLPGGEICHYLSYGRIATRETLARYRHNLVVHESDLPRGRGWSPLTWQVLEGAGRIPVTLIEAAGAVDSGPIHRQEWIELDGSELVEDLRRKQAASTLRLCRAFLAAYPESARRPRPQTGTPGHYRRRTPEDGRLDADLSLRAQFNLLRVSDNRRYPAWFAIAGQRYRLLIEKIEPPPENPPPMTSALPPSTGARRGERRTLLFTGGGGAGSEALARLLDERYEVHFADADPQARAASICAARWHRIPYADADGFVAALAALCRDIGADLLIPSVDEELLPIALARDTLPCPVLLPPAAFVERHLDKLASSAFLAKHGLPAPRTELLSERHAIFPPCIVKPRRGRGSRGVATVRSEAELQAHLLLSHRPASDFLAQELLPGQEYTVMMAADGNARLRAVVPVKVDIKRGITLRAETERDEAVIAACAAIHAASPVPGCYNIQLTRSAAGEVKPFEINPRISTTACLALAAGIDFVRIFSGGESEETAPGLLPFREGLRLRRTWYNAFDAFE